VGEALGELIGAAGDDRGFDLVIDEACRYPPGRSTVRMAEPDAPAGEGLLQLLQIVGIAERLRCHHDAAQRAWVCHIISSSIAGGCAPGHLIRVAGSFVGRGLPSVLHEGAVFPMLSSLVIAEGRGNSAEDTPRDVLSEVKRPYAP